MSLTEEQDSDCAQRVFPPLIGDAIVLTGPTASGKSAVALKLALAIGGEILSLDSIAVYKEMEIGTAKPSLADRQLAPHHLIDLVPPTEDFSVMPFLQAAHQRVSEIKERGRVPIFVGGTPMFLKGVLRGFDSGPPPDWEFRRAIEADVETYGAQSLHQRLQQVDPLAAHRIDATDTRRMIRALEVAYQTGQPLSHRQVQFDKATPAEQCRVFSIDWPREQLHARIEQRVDQMIQDGLESEVRGLLEKYGQLSRTASQAVGYREWLEAWDSEVGGGFCQEDVVEQIVFHTRQMAKRQATWFRSFSEVRSIGVSEPLDVDRVVEQIVKLV